MNEIVLFATKVLNLLVLFWMYAIDIKLSVQNVDCNKGISSSLLMTHSSLPAVTAARSSSLGTVIGLSGANLALLATRITLNLSFTVNNSEKTACTIS